MCHICGRQYGTRSIDIHLVRVALGHQPVLFGALAISICLWHGKQKACVKAFEAQEAQKPKHLRKPVPTAPELSFDTSELCIT